MIQVIIMDDSINVYCYKCDKILFSGTEKHARGLIIYCPDCAVKVD